MSEDILSRITLAEAAIKTYGKDIEDIKNNQREFLRLLFEKIDKMKLELHNLSLSSKDIVIGQQKEANKNKLWMLGILVGFLSQTGVGIILLILQSK